MFSLSFCEQLRPKEPRLQFRNVDGTTPAVYTFRTSPGHIWSHAQPYTHAVLTFPDQLPQLELHTGVYVSGKSGLIHEADVLVLLSEEAELARQNRVPPRPYKIFVAAERECSWVFVPIFGA